MMKPEYIAPCGLNCRVCSAIANDKPVKCVGCNGTGGYKYEYCQKCAIVHCEKRKTLPDMYCDTCPDYPCADVLEKQTRYTTAYPMYESPADNLAFLRANGMDALMQRETEYWSCPDCGGIISVHNGICEKCGKAYEKRP